jgi:hypothetical protein
MTADELFMRRLWESLTLARRIARTRKVFRRPFDERLIGMCITRKGTKR